MVKLSAMASHGYAPGLVLHSELGSCRVSKDCPSFSHSPGSRHDMIRLDSVNLRPHQSEESQKPVTGPLEATQLMKFDSIMGRPVLVDVQDSHPNSTLFCFGIAEQCTRHEKILQFLMSGSNEVERGGLDTSMLSDLMGLQTLAINMHRNPFASDYGSFSYGAEARPELIYPSSEFYSQSSLLKLAADFASRSEVMFHPDGRVPFTGVSTELKDILSVVAEYYTSRTSTACRKQSVIPYFNRLDFKARTVSRESEKFAPLKSSEKIKDKTLQKKKANKKAGQRDLYTKNYFHACESLLSVLIDKKRDGKTVLLSLKKCGPELPQLLTQFSASIAGTGLAVLFSVVYKVAYSRVPFCTSKVFGTSIGFGLVWLSWAVNKLRDTVVYIRKNSGKLGLEEEEMMTKLDRSVNEILLRAATLMAVAVLRLV